MSEQASYFRLGLFVLVAVGLLISGVVILGAAEWLEEGIPAETYLDESVQGLAVGAPVTHRGVRIGKVTRIGFVTEKYKMKDVDQEIRFGRYILVEMEFDVEKLPKVARAQRPEILAKRVAAGLRVRLQSSLTGPTILQADWFDPDVHKPLEINWEPQALYIPSAPGTMAQVVSAVERLASQVEEAELGKAINNLNTLIVNLDKAVKDLQVPELSKQMIALLEGVQGSNKSLRRLLDNPNLDKAINDLSASVASVKNVVVGSEDELKAFAADLPKISARLRSSSAKIDEILKGPEIKRILGGLADASDNAGPAMIQLRKVASRLENLLASQQQDIEALIRNFRKITDNAAALIEDAKDNPSRVIFGEPPPRRKPGEKP